MRKGGSSGSRLFLWGKSRGGPGEKYERRDAPCFPPYPTGGAGFPACAQTPEGGCPPQPIRNKTGRAWRPPGKGSGCGRPGPGRNSPASAAAAAQPEEKHQHKQGYTQIFHGCHLLLGGGGCRRCRTYSPPSSRFFISLFCRTISRQRMALSMARRICSLRKGLVI